jgi:hypothetical protein
MKYSKLLTSYRASSGRRFPEIPRREIEYDCDTTNLGKFPSLAANGRQDLAGRDLIAYRKPDFFNRSIDR